MTTDFVNGIFYALEGNKRYRIMQNVGDAQGFSIVAGMPLTATQFLNTSPWLGSMDIGVQKAVSKALKVKFSLQDVFYTNRYVANMNVPGRLVSNALVQWDSRVALLNVSYTFGNQKVKAARQRRTGSEEESSRAN